MGAGKTGMTYSQAGVDIDAGNALVERIKPAARQGAAVEAGYALAKRRGWAT